jgi:hypothetical protein
MSYTQSAISDREKVVLTVFLVFFIVTAALTSDRRITTESAMLAGSGIIGKIVLLMRLKTTSLSSKNDLRPAQKIQVINATCRLDSKVPGLAGVAPDLERRPLGPILGAEAADKCKDTSSEQVATSFSQKSR